MARAKLIVLGDEEKRFALAATMQAHGRDDEAREQRAALLATGASRSWEFYETSKLLGNDAAGRGDFRAAADLQQRFALQVLDRGGVFVERLAYVDVPLLVHRNRGHGLLLAGDAAGGMREMRAFLAVKPLHLPLAIDFVPLFEKAGYRKEADELFGLVFTAVRAQVERYPDSPLLNNDLAWLASQCNREPEAALAHALRAAEVDPADPNILDTLADVYHRRGDRDHAVALIRECIELEPAQPRHRKRLAEFGGDVP